MTGKNMMKYIMAGGFLILMSAYFLPLIKVWELQISVSDFLGFSSDLTTILDEYEEYTEFLRQAIDSYRIPCILLMVLPVFEAALVVFLKEKQGILAAVLSLVVNNTIAFILYDKLRESLDYVNDSLLGVLLDVSLRIEPLPVALWLIVHAVILIVAIAGAMGEYKKSKKEIEEQAGLGDMKEIVMEQFHLNRQKDAAPQYGEKEVKLMAEKPQTSFYGGILGETGNCKGKVYLLDREEKVTLGSEDTDDIFIVGAMDKMTLCLISYDIKQEEYHVRPLKKNAVFLKNRQPLGKDRVYCIPRGKTLIIDNRKNMFTLA